jgi:hypothetical protein
MTVDERGHQAASALLDSTRNDLEAFAMLREITDHAGPRTDARRPLMTALAAAAVVVAIVAGWWVIRSAQTTTHAVSTTPVSTDTPAPQATPVVSAVYRYSAVAPAGWTYRAGSKPWAYGADQGAAGVQDAYRSPTSPATIFVTSQSLPPGMTQATWLTKFLPGSSAAMPSCFPATAAVWAQDRVLVDGHPGGMWGGQRGCSFTEVVVFAGDRVYDISAQPDPSKVNTDIFDNAVLTPFLASMRLTP